MNKNAISIEPSRAVFPPTYLRSNSKISVKILNNSDSIIKYEWRQYPTVDEELHVLSFFDALDPNDRVQNANLLHYKSEVFHIEPLSSEIWPHRYQQIVINFRPQEAKTYQETFYLYDLNNHSRIPLSMQGMGLPAEAQLSVEIINAGHILLENKYEYQIILRNTGQVPLDFMLDPFHHPHLSFTFSPNRGHLEVGSQIPINIILFSTIVGQFTETFTFRILGSQTGNPTLTIHGRVIGPSFLISKKKIDFGIVSFGFLYSQSLDIENTSEIPFDYSLSFIHDSSFDNREFRILPDSGTIPRFSKQQVKVEFIPVSLREYSIQLRLTSPKFESSLMIIPITASSISPEIHIDNNIIEAGRLFINKKYSFPLSIVNESPLPAKFEFLDNEETSLIDAIVVPESYSGLANPHSNTEVKIFLTPKQVGTISIRKYIRVIGSDKAPLGFSINATSIGPTLEFSEKIIDFGSLELLKSYKKTFSITNNSQISAKFKANFDQSSSVFNFSPSNGVIESNQTAVFTINALLDESFFFHSDIVMIFDYLAPISVIVRATGIGTPIVSSRKLDLIEMGSVFVGESAIQEFTLQNHGRRNQEIRWTINRSKNDGFSKLIAKIEPDITIITPGSIGSFRVFYQSPKPCDYNMTANCQVIQNKKRMDLFIPVIKGSFVMPIVHFAKSSIEFRYVHDIMKEEQLSGKLVSKIPLRPSQSLLNPIVIRNSLSNNSSLPINVLANSILPFEVLPSEFTVAPHGNYQFDIRFNTISKTDFLSETIYRKVLFDIQGGILKLNLDLKAQFVFPNISISANNSIFFGTLAKNTETTKDYVITNISEIPVTYEWELQYTLNNGNIARTFDIFPIRGVLNPGQKEKVCFTFFASWDSGDGNKQYTGIAICHVIGGPDYTIKLNGDSAALEYKVEPQHITVQNISYNEEIKHQVSIENISEVDLDFIVKIPQGIGFRNFIVEPSSGNISANKNTVINLKIVAGLPKRFKETFFIQIGHFNEVEIELSIDCHFPQLDVSIPRALNDPIVMYNCKKSRKGINSLYQSNNNIQLTKERIATIERKILVERLSGMPTIPVRSSHHKRGQKEIFNGYISSKFVVDFGNIILGQSKRKVFKFTSMTPFPISLELDTHSLDGTGFYARTVDNEELQYEQTISIEFGFESNQRTLESIGDQLYEILILLSDDLAYSVSINSSIEMPSLILSKQSFDFEPTIVGQKRIYTLQLQNMNPISCEYSFGSAVTAGSSIKNRLPSTYNDVFVAMPSNGVLPASSFQNIEICFGPKSEKLYSMQFNIDIKHNIHPQIVSLKGNGIQMKVLFDPPEVKYPPIKPFSNPIDYEFTITNPTSYPITIYSLQYDFGILVDQLIREAPNSFESSIQSSSSYLHFQNNVSKFAFCIIVHGPMKSGKSEVSKIISRILNGIPILSLKDIWMKVVSQQNYSMDDLTSALLIQIEQPGFESGFIIDGLDCLGDPSETDSFIVQCLKHKNFHDEISKNPLLSFPHSFLTSIEQAIEIILRVLNGHYVFHIAINSNEKTIIEHEKIIADSLLKIQNEEKKVEINRIMNMSEDDYFALDGNAREEIDRKRNEYRKDLIHSLVSQNSVGFVNPNSKGSSNDQKNSRKAQKSKSSVPNNPRELSILLFQTCLGSICNNLKEGAENFQSIDPSIIHKRKLIPVSDNTKDESLYKCSITYYNSLIINGSFSLSDIENDLFLFLPSITDLKDCASKRLISPPKLVLPNNDNSLSINDEDTQYFSIYNTEPPGEWPTSKSYQSPNNKRGSRKQILRDEPLINPSITDAIDIMQYTKRWDLMPGSSTSITVRFYGKMIGEYSGKLKFGICDSSNDLYEISLSASIVYPNIDRSPFSVFPCVVKTIQQRTEYCYILNTNEFHFGPQLVINPKSGKGSTQIYKQQLTLKNISGVDAEITPILSDNGPKSVWNIDSKSIRIPANESSFLTLSFCPLLPDTYKNTLSLFVKDNPDPFLYSIVADGCSPFLELSTNNLDFEKILTKQDKTLTIHMANNGKVATYWKIRSFSTLGPNFEISSQEGIVNNQQSVSLSVKFSSSKPIIIKKAIQIDFMDKNKTRTFSSQHINIIAESFDVSYEFIFPKNQNHLNYGPIKVSQPKELSLQIKNKGKYPIIYNSTVLTQYSCQMKVSPSHSVVQPGDKTVSMSVIFETNEPISLENEKGLLIKISDFLTKSLISNSPISFSVVSAYSKASLSPLPNLDFGSIATLTSFTKKIELHNHGLFPFEFEIIPKADSIFNPSPPEFNTGSQKKRPVKTPMIRNVSSKKKQTMTKMSVGAFLFSHIFGVVNPGETFPINVEFSGAVPGLSKASAIFKISDSDPSEINGVTYDIIANCYSPSFVTEKFEKIFPGLHLCLRGDLDKSDILAFLEDDHILHFSPMCLEDHCDVSFVLYNNNPIPCEVSLLITPKNHNSKSDLGFPFIVSESSILILPHSSYKTIISFYPKSCDTFQGVFEAIAQGRPKESPLILKFGLEGTGTLPSIIQLPSEGEKAASNVVSFGRTVLGVSKEKTVRLLNNGLIPCSIKLSSKPVQDFVLLNSDNQDDVNVIYPGKEFKIFVSFCPMSIKRSQFDVNVSVIGNEIASINLQFVGEGFSEEVMLEGIPGDENCLIFRDNVVGRQQQAVFQIKNSSLNHIKFTWPVLSDFVFSPRIGHIKKGMSKTITVTFYSEKPVKHNSIKASCQWQKISYNDSDVPDWDDSMRIIKFISKSENPESFLPIQPQDDIKSRARNIKGAPSKKKISVPPMEIAPIDNKPVKLLELKPEPLFSLLNIKTKDIIVKITAVSDNIKYSLSTNEISFAPTMMYESRSTICKLSNMSQIRLDFQWNPNILESSRIGSSSNASPFRIEPSSGYIEAGQSTNFIVHFSPTEVDDFKAVFVCDIPYLSSSDPPRLIVTGISRRPLCHFNVVTSDYLSSGRRHPDYIEQLPDDVKVIEIFSNSIKLPSTLRFEIINTTSEAFDVFWKQVSGPVGVIECQTPIALLSSGKRYPIVFTYTPTSIKTIETLWEFTIPEHSITIVILIVGRITPVSEK